MWAAGVKARHRRKYKVTTNSDHKQPVFENVVKRNFTVAEPDQAYVSDITYIWTQEGWLYLAVFIDLFSRRLHSTLGYTSPNDYESAMRVELKKAA